MMARKLLESRVSKIGFVVTTLTLVMWLSASIWLDANAERKSAELTLETGAHEHNLNQLASVLSSERDIMYRLLSVYGNDTKDYSESDIDAFVNTGIQADRLFSRIQIETELHYASHQPGHQSARHASTHNASSDAAMVGPITVSGAGMPPVAELAAMSDSGNHTLHQVLNITESFGELSDLYRSLPALRKKVLSLINNAATDLHANPAMRYFHSYMQIIDSIDKQRRAEQSTLAVNRQEIFVHVQLSNAVWNLIESTSQIVTLLEGTKASVKDGNLKVDIGHHSQMLYGLNMEVDLHLGELLRVNESIDSEAISESISALAQWYPTNYRSVSWRAQRMSVNGYIPLGSLGQWASAAAEVRQRATSIRQQNQDKTLASVKDVHARSTTVLVINSVLGVLALIMAIASLFFFRKLQQQAYSDELTGLHNRRSFTNSLSQRMEQATVQQSSLGLLAIDLDRFKYVNDTMAQENGDQLLQDVAARLRQVVTQDETVARLGGDEFGIIHRCSDPFSAQELAAKVSTSLSAPFFLNGTTLNIGCSVGVARFPNDAGTPDALIKAADIALYRARKNGTGQIVSYDRDMEKALLKVARTEQDLKVALEQQQFQLYYQPQYNLASCRVESVEALLRWHHPKHGMVPPDRFIPIAEQAGLMPTIGQWVINEAVSQAASWRSQAANPLRVAVNVSSEQFLCSGFADAVMACLEQHQLPGDLLEIELTESVAMCDMQLVVEILDRMRGAGIKIALDDFGTGYSSLSYLQDLPLDTLKIDKSFVQKLLTGDERLESITESIVSLGKSLNLDTVAEGVETCDQLNHVFDMGISVVQGYFYSRPVPAEELAQVIIDINDTDPPGESHAFDEVA